MRKLLISTLLLLTACSAPQNPAYDVPAVSIPSSEYAEAASVVFAAQSEGYSNICTIEREGAENRRTAALNGHRIESGYHRMQYPPATCAEGGEGAYVESISKKASRSFGGYWGSQIADLPDGTIIKIEVTE